MALLIAEIAALSGVFWYRTKQEKEERIEKEKIKAGKKAPPSRKGTGKSSPEMIEPDSSENVSDS